jgi:hypothetical protein
MAKYVWHRIFLDSNLLEKLFVHIRNVFYCSLILAVGTYTHDHPPDFLRGTPLDPYFGYPLIAIGLFLFLLNLVDSLNQILKIEYNSLAKIFLILIHVVLTGWLAMVMWFFRIK